MSEEDYEATLLVIRECYVYKLPPRTNVSGYKAADWDLNNPIWQGRLRVVSQNEKCFIKLEDTNSVIIFFLKKKCINILLKG